MLRNFLHLVCVVDNASRRSTTLERRQAVRSHMLQYLDDLQELYPGARIKPNHHLTLHLPQFLANFGPPHSWWAYPFERINGLLQRIPTNSRFRKFILRLSSLPG